MLTVIIYSAHETSEGRSHNLPTNADHTADRDHLLQSARASWDPQGLLWCSAASNPGLGPTAVCGRPLPETGMVKIWHLPVVMNTCVHRCCNSHHFPLVSCFNLSIIYLGKTCHDSVWEPAQQKPVFYTNLNAAENLQQTEKTGKKGNVSDMWSDVKKINKCLICHTLNTTVCVLSTECCLSSQ